MPVKHWHELTRLPAPGDNAAIAAVVLKAGSEILIHDQPRVIQSTILEGHRMAVTAIAKGEALLSWGQAFGFASRDIKPGEYLCNAAMLAAMRLRQGEFALPDEPNFTDAELVFNFDESRFKPGKPITPAENPATFEGYYRPGGKRGTGTRNTIVLMGVSSRAASFARALERRLQHLVARFPNVDGIVAIAHTEGAERGIPNNREKLLATLAGFMVHANSGAVLAIDDPRDELGNRALEDYLHTWQYPLEDVLHRFYSLTGDLESALTECAEYVTQWLDLVNQAVRTPRPLSDLKIALQCGGSDAFSGVSGNPLAALVARRVIEQSGSAILAETDELVGAEQYILENTRSLDVARVFLEKIRKFEERAAWHGQSVRGNPTGGNKFRGLYNITLKSLGAARKKDPGVRLDYVIDYGQRMDLPGFYFMDSPGNDLESIAGQVASGCNLIFFITGNGSITNFPFVPTLKFMTTTSRWNLMSSDMDINAGRYQDGEALEDLAGEAFELTVEVASGRRTRGEGAGHAQVSIWRNWQQTDAAKLEDLKSTAKPDGKPVPITTASPDTATFDAWRSGNGFAIDRVALILPTSLCSGQIAVRIADDLNKGLLPGTPGVSRFVTLPHTEGCGASSGDNEELYLRTLSGYLVHPLVNSALLLEHGCEHTHNDLFRNAMERHSIEPDQFGYASIQLDGGIEKVSAKVRDWFTRHLDPGISSQREQVGLEAMTVGLAVSGPVTERVAQALADLISRIVASGGTVTLPSGDGLLQSDAFLQTLGLDAEPPPTLAYGQPFERAGMHIMQMPGSHMVETLSGLGATGVQLLLVYTASQSVQAHPLIPMLQLSSASTDIYSSSSDMDYVIDDQDHTQIGRSLMRLLCETASGTYVPILGQAGYTDFQVTRGRLGISL